MKTVFFVVVLATAATALLTSPSAVSYEAYMASNPHVSALFWEEGVDRVAVFGARVEKIAAHNRRYEAGEVTWFEGLTDHTALTDAERRGLRGYRADMRGLGGKYAVPWTRTVESEAELPAEVDWRSHQPSVMTAVKNQGQCGSCWTFATTEAMESHYALATGSLQVLSEQMVLETPNPEQCGGTGGCQGGTAQLAYDYMIDAWKGGLALEWTYPYTSFFGKNFAPLPNNSPAKTPAAFISGYHQLPQNDALALLEAVATHGPIAISVDASVWHDYKGGVFNGCNNSAPTVDHAVNLVGYGTDPKFGPYWLVRNSWATSFGEFGYIRIARPAQTPCGTDSVPGEGFSCKNQTEPIHVCGTCAIASDSCFPIPVASL